MDIKEGTEEVQTPEGAGTETPPVETSEQVSSPEVKVEPKSAVNVDKLQEQVNNLNIALKQEREAKKTDYDAVKRMEAELAEARGTISKLSEVFNPVQKEETQEAPPAGLTLEQLESFWEQKEQEKTQKQKEQEQAAMIQNEIKDMETKWDGSGGKPKYDDSEVIAWQKANNKLYLTPRAAFFEMKHGDIVDYEVKQRLSGKPNVQNVETPGGVPTGREPKETGPMGEAETRNAVLEAMDAVLAENNN